MTCNIFQTELKHTQPKEEPMIDIIEIIYSAYTERKISKHSKQYKELCQIVKLEERLLSTFDKNQKQLYFKFDKLVMKHNCTQDEELIKFSLKLIHDILHNKSKSTI